MTNAAPNSNLGPPSLPALAPPGSIPPGESLAWLAANDRTMYEQVLQEIIKESNEAFEEACKAYMDALFVYKQPSREKRLAAYMLKTPQLWQEQRFLFPGPSYLPNFTDDWKDYTELVGAAMKGDFDDEPRRQVIEQATGVNIPSVGDKALQGYGQVQATLAAGGAA